MKNCAIMPDIVGMKRQAGLGNIGVKPADGFRQGVRLPFARQVKGNMRNIQNCQLAIPALQQIVHQGGSPAPDINHRSRPVAAGRSLNQ
jgi:hypothetical protein